MLSNRKADSSSLVVYALGGGFAYTPAILFLDEWFIRRKGLAFGIMWVS
jgi:hypothetical protein